MRKPVRRRFVKRKGQRKQALVQPTENTQESTVESDGSTPQTSQQDETSVTATAQDASDSLTTSNATSGFSTSASVITSPGFHDYTNLLSPKKSLLITSPHSEAPSITVSDAPTEESAEHSSKRTSSICPSSLNQSGERTSDTVSLQRIPPKVALHVLNDVKLKVEAFLPERWLVILRQTDVHVVLISKQSTLSIQRNIVFSTCGKVSLEVHCKSFDCGPYLKGIENGFLLTEDSVNDFAHRIVQIVNRVSLLEICAGYDDEKYKDAWETCQMGEVDCNPYQECRYVETFRSKSCHQLVHWTHWRCTECRKLFGPLKRRAKAILKEEPKPTTGNKYLTEEQLLWKLKEQQKALNSAKKKILRLEEKMQEVIRKEAVFVDQDLSEDLMNVLNSDIITPAQSIFLQQQIKSSQQKNVKGMRWHPTMIRLALSLYIQCPSAYEMLRGTGMIKLPSSRTLFDYSHVKPAKEGIDGLVLNDLAAKVSKFGKKHQRYHVLMADEMHIFQNLVFQKSSGSLVGYTTLDEVDKEMKRLEDIFEGKDDYEDTVATKVLVYMVKGISNGLKDVVATYAVGNLATLQLYVWTWEVIGALERSGILIVAFISDGCSVNRSFIKMHVPVTKLSSGVVFDTINKAARNRILYFMSDVPHLLKTIRNCFLNSRTDKKKGRRLLSRKGMKITWNSIIKLYHEKKGKNLRKSFKLNAMNVFPDSYSRMKVKYAAQVISRTVAQDLEDQGWPGTSETIFFIRFVNDWFDCLNGAHSSMGKRKLNSNLNPYTSERDSRFEFILSFLSFLEEWEKEARNLNCSVNCSAATDLPVNDLDEDTIDEGTEKGEEDDTPGSKRILSRQTLEGIEMTSRAFIDAVKFLLSEGTDFINARVFTQDPLEQHFSKIRAGQGGSTNPNLGQVLNRNRALHTIGQLGMKKRKGNAGEENSKVEVTTASLPKRKCVRFPDVTD